MKSGAGTSGAAPGVLGRLSDSRSASLLSSTQKHLGKSRKMCRMILELIYNHILKIL